jgi:di/tricarboxylate transporter
MAITFVILAITIVMFGWDRFSPDLVAIGSLLALFLTGVIGLEPALSGFSNSTVILIAALFIVGEGLTETGVTAWFGDRLIGSSRGSPMRLLVLLMTAGAVMSAFISNTGTVATLMPAVVVASWGVRSHPSAVLIPLAFSASVGGLLTLTGTPPNVVISEALDAAGQRPFGFFEYAWIGVPLLVVTVVYMVTVGRKLLPRDRSAGAPVALDREMIELADAYSLDGVLFRLRVRVGSPLIGSTLRESDLGHRYGVAVLEIHPVHPDTNFEHRLPRPLRDQLERLRGEPAALPDPDQRIAFNDVLIVSGTAEEVRDLELDMRLGVLPIDDAGRGLADLLSQEVGIAEVLLTPRSSFIGTVVGDGAIGQRGVLVLGIRRGERLVSTTEPLEFGDALLVRGTWEAIGHLAGESRNFVVVGRPEVLAHQVTELNTRSVVALAALAGMVVLMVTGAVPVVMAALLASGVMLAAGCLTTTQAYRAVSWSTVVLIGAMIPMAVALETTGGALWIADRLVDTVGSLGPTALLAGIMLVAMAFSQVISNTAAAVLMSPIVITAASGLGVDPHPMMMGLAVAASTAFLTPIATPPNLVVMAPGDYRFTDFPKVGAALTALFLVVGVALIPIIWPF